MTLTSLAMLASNLIQFNALANVSDYFKRLGY